MPQIQVRDKFDNAIRGIYVRVVKGHDNHEIDPGIDDKPSDFAGNLAFPNIEHSDLGYTLQVNNTNVNPKYKAEYRNIDNFNDDIKFVMELVELQRVHIDGDNFRTEDGKRWLWNMGSNFSLAHLVAEGEDIRPKLYKNLNGYRIFGTYFNIANQMGLKPFNPMNYPNWLNAISDTFDILLSENKYGQLNLLCDCSQQGFSLGQMRDMHRSVTELLKTKKNAFYSLGNENEKNGFNADDFDRPSGIIAACGSGLTGGPAPLSRGNPWDIQHQHLRRDEKMFIDIPPVDAPTYSLQHKVIFDETIGYADFDSGSRTSRIDWAYKMGKIMGAFNGGTIHLQCGGHSENLTTREEECNAAFSKGMLGDLD